MPFGLNLRAHAQPAVNLHLHFILTWAWYVFFLFYIGIGKAYDFTLRDIVFSVAQLGLAPGVMSVIVALSWLGFVLHDLFKALVC